MEKWLKTLKSKLRDDKNLGDIMSFFFDSTEANPEILGQGVQARDPLLEAILLEIGKAVFGKKAKLEQLLCIRLPVD